VLEVINKTYRLHTRNATPHRLESPDLQEYGVNKLWIWTIYKLQ